MHFRYAMPPRISRLERIARHAPHALRRREPHWKDIGLRLYRWWAQQDSNPRSSGYEPAAYTAMLCALVHPRPFPLRRGWNVLRFLLLLLTYMGVVGERAVSTPLWFECLCTFGAPFGYAPAASHLSSRMNSGSTSPSPQCRTGCAKQVWCFVIPFLPGAHVSVLPAGRSEQETGSFQSFIP